MVQRDRLAVDQTVAASGAPGSLADPGAPTSGPAASRTSSRLTVLRLWRWLRLIAGVVPFGVYVTLGLLLPMVAVAVGAFENSDGGGFTLSNIRAATHGIYLRGFWQSIELSVITAILPGIVGLLIAYAICVMTARVMAKFARRWDEDREHDASAD
jgi:ABC-type Fe3+ transport system permease subunit